MIDKLYHYKAKIVSVYDADTVRADIDFGFGRWGRDIALRLLGINAPELRGDEKPQGIISRDALRSLILDQDVIIRTFKKGKYGRYLADIFLNDIDVNKWLVENGFAEYKDYN